MDMNYYKKIEKKMMRMYKDVHTCEIIQLVNKLLSALLYYSREAYRETQRETFSSDCSIFDG